jgi:hypothetical protein
MIARRLAIAVMTLALFPVSAGGQNQSRTWSFDSLPAGALGTGFTAGPGDWKIQLNPAATSQPNVLAQLAKNDRPVFNVLLVSDTDYKDLDLSVRMHAVAGEIDQGGGLVWRARDAQNYYIARYNPLEDNYRVYKVVDGKRTQLQSADAPKTGGWRTLRITMKGDAIECFLDGKRFLQIADSTFTGPGKIGLWTKADAQTLFDDLTVTSLKAN